MLMNERGWKDRGLCFCLYSNPLALRALPLYSLQEHRGRGWDVFLFRFCSDFIQNTPSCCGIRQGGEEAYPCHYRYRYYLTLPSLRATSSIFCWAKHPVMLRDTAKEEENTPQSSEGIKRFKVILSIYRYRNSPQYYGARQGRRRNAIYRIR